MATKIKAAVAREHDKPLTVEDLELDDLGRTRFGCGW
jgi:Zn-dependent alcohol dehydrogenase